MIKETLIYDEDMAGRIPTKEAPPFGQRLAAARKHNGWSQTELAKRLSVSRALIDYYERRATNPTIDFLHRAAKALDVAVIELVGSHKETPQKRSGPASKLEKQVEEVRKLPRTKQRFVSELLATVLQRATS